MRKAAAGALIGLGASMLVLLLALAGLFDVVELTLYDWRIRRQAGPAGANADIALVNIDDDTLRDLEPLLGRWPWPRVAHSLLVSFLHRGGARVIAYDVGFWERDLATRDIAGQQWKGSESDAALVDAVRQAGNVVLLGDAVYAGAAEQQSRSATWKDPGYRLGPQVEERPMLLAPFQELADAGAGIGHNFLPLDPDGRARRMPPFIRVGGRYVPSLGVAAALHAAGIAPADVTIDGRVLRFGDKAMELTTVRVDDAAGSSTAHDQLSMLINFRTAPEDPGYRTYSARFLLNAENQIQSGEEPDLDPAVFRNRIVFVGASASGAHDVFQTPFGGAAMSGIHLHASMADSILAGRFIREAPAATRVAAVLVAAVTVGVLTVYLSYSWGVVAALALGAAWLGIAVLFFRDGVWVNASQPLASMALALFATTAYRYFVEDREKRKVKKLFGRYVSRDVYEQLLAHPDRAELGGKRREMTVLFSDIRGFTSVTETGQPEELVSQLNEYFSRMVDIVFRHRGTVDKFVGDMVMALFGAPLDDPGHADHAVAAAVEMVDALGALNRKWAAEGRPRLDIGIGINSGEMIAGNIGSSSIMSYTVIGDNVNLGSRLESLNKEYRTRIIISDATRARLAQPYDLRPLGDVVVRGKTLPVAIFEVRVPSPLPEDAGPGRPAREASL